MSAKIPESLIVSDYSRYLKDNGYKLISQGKTRDIYCLGNNLLLIVASDRISIFDFVLNCWVPLKGEILTAFVHFWMTKILYRFPNHLVNSEKYPDRNMVHDLGLPPNIMKRSLVVKQLDIIPEEIIIRGYLSGSVYDEYLRTEMVGGNILPSGLKKWEKLERPIFTPSTKAVSGHDINYSKYLFYGKYGTNGARCVDMFLDSYLIMSKYLSLRGLNLLDYKGESDLFIFADELGTPDCCRICDKKDYDYAMANGIDPTFYDKEEVRKWGRTVNAPFYGNQIVGMNNLDPNNHEHLYFVHNHLIVPSKIITSNTSRSLELFERVSNATLTQYQENDMMICG